MAKGGNIFYHVYTGSFADGNGDGIGDIKGLINKLDYLNDGKGGGLGITGIWLFPIHRSHTYHKYDVLDYFSVDPDYGTVEDIRTLAKEAKKRGIDIILDLVFNCMAGTSEMFIDALHNPKSPYRDYFYFYDKYKGKPGFELDAKWNTLPAWHTVPTLHGDESYISLYHALMPDLNFENKKVREMCKDVASFWLEIGVAGFRLDSAMHLYSVAEVAPGVDYHQKNIDWWKEFSAHCQSIKKDIYLVGEVWDIDPRLRARYMQGLGSCFHFFLGAFIGEAVSAGRDNGQKLANHLAACYEAYRETTGGDYMDAPFLSNHDDHRYIGNYVFNETDAKLAASIYLTLEGCPYIYYGEELGYIKPGKPCAKTNFKWMDSDSFLQSRTAFLWGEGDACQTDYITFDDARLLPKDAEQQKQDPNSIYSHYVKLIKTRKKFNALLNGRCSMVNNTNESLLVYRMETVDEQISVVHNLSDISVKYDAPPGYVFDIQAQSEEKVSGFVTLTPKSTILSYCDAKNLWLCNNTGI